MNISESGQAMIESFEGCRLTAYADSVGILTIGVGHTGPEVHAGLVWTPEQAMGVLLSDLSRFENCVDGAIIVPMQQNQFDAMVSLAFNIGEGNFSKSTVRSKMNRKDIQGAADAFLMWVFAKGQKVAGLENRRQAERKMFLTGAWR